MKIFNHFRLPLMVLALTMIAVPGQAQTWENLPGQAKAIAVGGDSTDVVWIIGRSDAVYKWDDNSFTWQDFGGKAQIITVEDNGTPWVINNLQIFRLRGQVWQSMPGKAKDIAAGGGTVWTIGENGAAFKWDEDSFSWQNFGGSITSITVDNKGVPWAINNMQIYRLRGQVWQNMPGKARAIGAGGGQVWAVGENWAVNRWNEDAFSWGNVGGKVRSVDSGGTGTPYAIQDTGTLIYRLRGWK